MNKLADYGTVVMVALTQNSPSLMTARDLADKTHIPLPTVKKVLKQLAHKKLVQSKQGIQGGYALVKLPESISVMEIMEALDRPFAFIECSQSGVCAIEHICQAKTNWQMIAQSLRHALKEISLAVLAQKDAVFHIRIEKIPSEKCYEKP